MTFPTDKDLLLAFCGCDLERFTLTRGALKQKWPVCGCNKSMRIKNVPASAFSIDHCIGSGACESVAAWLGMRLVFFSWKSFLAESDMATSMTSSEGMSHQSG